MSAPARLALLALVACAVVAALAWQLIGAGSSSGAAANPRARELERVRSSSDVPELAEAPQKIEAAEIPSNEASERAAASTDGGAASIAVPVAIVVGRAVDRSGAPLADVAVSSQLRTRPLVVHSGVDGRFDTRLASNGEGDGIRVSLSLERKGFGPASVDKFVTYGQTFDAGDVVLPRAGTVSGRVVDEHGAALANAEICVTDTKYAPHPASNRGPATATLASAESDALGTFRIDDVGPGPVRVWAGAGERRWTAIALDVPEDGAVTDVELVVRSIERNRMIRMTVLDPASEPARGAHVEYVGSLGSGTWRGGGSTDDGGHFTLFLDKPAPHDFTASDARGRFRPAAAKNVLPGTLDLVLQLSPSQRATLAVRDGDGAAVERYRVDRSVVRGANVRSELFIPDKPHAGGRAEFELPTEPFELAVDAPGFELARVGPLDPASVGTEIVVALREVPAVRGKVLAAGKPLGDIRVTLHLATRPDEESNVDGFLTRSRRDGGEPALTADDGTFVATLRQPGRYYVRAATGTSAPAELGPFDLDPAVGARDLVLELTPGGDIFGHVLGPDGQPAANQIVGASRGDGFAQTTRSDARGAFRFVYLTPGRWWVGCHDLETSSNGFRSQSGTAARPVEVPWNCVVVEGETTQIDIAPPPADVVRLEGRVEYGDAPATGWHVNLSPKNQGWNPGRKATTDARGRFEVSAREPGEYYLALSSSFGGPHVSIHAPLTLREGDNAFELATPVGRVEGRVEAFDPTQDACSWIWVRDGVQISASFATDADGAFALDDVPAGRVKLSRKHASSGELSRKVEITVERGVTAHAEL